MSVIRQKMAPKPRHRNHPAHLQEWKERKISSSWDGRFCRDVWKDGEFSTRITHSGRGGVPPKNDSMPSCNVGATHNGVRHECTRAHRNIIRNCKLDLVGTMEHGNRANNGDECGATTGERALTYCFVSSIALP